MHAPAKNNNRSESVAVWLCGITENKYKTSSNNRARVSHIPANAPITNTIIGTVRNIMRCEVVMRV